MSTHSAHTHAHTYSTHIRQTHSHTQLVHTHTDTYLSSFFEGNGFISFKAKQEDKWLLDVVEAHATVWYELESQ